MTPGALVSRGRRFAVAGASLTVLVPVGATSADQMPVVTVARTADQLDHAEVVHLLLVVPDRAARLLPYDLDHAQNVDAGAPGIEPGPAGLEAAVLAVTPHPHGAGGSPSAAEHDESFARALAGAP